MGVCINLRCRRVCVDGAVGGYGRLVVKVFVVMCRGCGCVRGWVCGGGGWLGMYMGGVCVYAGVCE